MRKLLVLILSKLFLLQINVSGTTIQKTSDFKASYNRAHQLSQQSPDSAIILFKKLINNQHFPDSLKTRSLLHLSKLQHRKQNFPEAFEYAQNSLLIAESLRDSSTIAATERTLGILYQEFGKEEESKEFLNKSLSLYKSLVESKKLKPRFLSGAYFTIAGHYSHFFKFDSSLLYLDSCDFVDRKMNRPPIYSSYHRSEQALVYLELGQIDSTKRILHNIEAIYQKELNNERISYATKGFIAMIYYYLGNLYLKEKDFNRAIDYFNLSLESDKKYGFHNRNTSKTLENLAQAQFNINLSTEAYQNLKMSKRLNDEYLSIDSERNKSIFEIKNKYEEEINLQKSIVSKQRQTLLIFQIAIVSVIAITIISFLLYRNRVQQKRLIIEKENNLKKQNEAKVKIDIKNKELTAFTLKLIDREEVINSLAQKLKDKSKGDGKTLNSLKVLNSGSEALWEEFNSRFVEVNSGFYEELQKRFPELSPTERKHCALIKLNFSAKEMARLLGISDTSVHVSRYRLRKKFNLSKKQNLTDFINGIGY
ncbi:tetratricopeptide repeat protein [Reichenbachiella versicolor]|uniref:tetratricopeptide repeat protein n=1 Tax=Reichenbachiella versicolor TaxID=1821036 RepID=UPI0013A56A6F|nr:tetratricopeptide repeat protein [Reichenbachiella versicolor]